ncbi:hypothetical protein AGOR_G00067090 [Albula goreensis]|uniref:Protein-glutamine gamma-glutamyltransferase 2 n=1 Tax=Albula goreensis TaxID=1534307 RepID=A0A8T3DR61_9TELE|nr:hypothetical protein AGOR_G00067090 [Albula goreensis]
MAKVDLHYEKNNKEHKTDEISTKRLIVRRGQPFLLSFNTNISPDALEFTVQTGPAPSEALGTKCVFGVNQNGFTKTSWEAKITESYMAFCTFAITSPADASIGKYDLSVRDKSCTTEGHKVESFVVLFNPWCAEDWVHLPSETERQEYVMNEEGVIYRGSHNYISAMEWDFGQFEDDIMDICLKLLDVNPKCLDNAGEDFSARCNPIYVGRVISAMSAHDTDGNLIIDEYLSENGVRPIESTDSVWNFHVWVEGWMRRPDLSAESFYDGWQVLDPTPQELSDGTYCCGPAPVKAVQEGHTDLKYDLPFIFAEVNADRVTWLVAADGSKRRMRTDSASIGRNISTKAVGSYRRSNISSDYKHPEGSQKEREAFKEAVRRSNKLTEPTPEPTPARKKISVKIEEQSKPINGKDIDLTLVLESDDPDPRSLEIHINAQAMLYNGVLSSDICTEVKHIKMLHNREQRIPIQIPFSKYGECIRGCSNNIKVTAVVIDKEDGETVYLAERDIVPGSPPFTITIAGSAVLCGLMVADIVFENPLPVTLRNCSITVTGSGLVRRAVESRFASLGAGQRVRVQVPFAPYRAGSRKLLADFDCDQICDIKASRRVTVKAFYGFPRMM